MEKLKRTFIPLLEESVVDCLTIIAGTKLDLVATKGRQVKSSEGFELAEQLYTTQVEMALKKNLKTHLKGIDPKKLYFETSAKTNVGIEEMFEHIQTIFLPHLKKSMPKRGSIVTKSAAGVTVINSEPPAGRRRCCGN